MTVKRKTTTCPWDERQERFPLWAFETEILIITEMRKTIHSQQALMIHLCDSRMDVNVKRR